MDTNKAKKKILELYAKTFGNISQCCDMVGIVRQTYYNWYNSDEKFKKAIDEIEPQEKFIDFCESKLISKINKEDTASIIYALKTKGKHRGWAENVEHTGHINFINDIPDIDDGR